MSSKRTIALAVALTMLVSALAFAPAASAGVYVSGGVRIYAPLPPVRHEVVIARPGPRYVWVPGYWRPYGGHYGWVAGAWVVPPYPYGYWVAPHVAYYHHHPYYYGGHWAHGHGHGYGHGHYGHGYGHGHGHYHG